MNKLIKADFDGTMMQFTSDGWFNATESADRFGRRVDNWLRLDETEGYMQALADALNTSDVRELIRTQKGRNGGTWLHPKLAVRFAQWLDARFAVWCDMQIDGLIRGPKPADDWRKLRHDAGARFRGVCDMVNLSRMAEGKSASAHHYANEANLINWALTGQFAPVNRDALTTKELRLLELLEAQDMLLIGRGLAYAERKEALQAFAQQQRQRLALPANDRNPRGLSA